MRRRSGFLFLLIVSLLLVSTAGCADKPAAPTESGPPEPLSPKDFLAQNLSALNVIRDLDNLEGYKLLDPFLEDNEVFLTGEWHGVHFNKILSLQFLKYFHQNAGVKYYLIESSPATAAFWNLYLSTGDDSILDRAMKHFMGSATCSEDTAALLSGIREYNLSLPEDERIVLVGADIEHRTGVAADFGSRVNTFLPLVNVRPARLGLRVR